MNKMYYSFVFFFDIIVLCCNLVLCLRMLQSN
jgi:hypothetical protein